MTFTRRALVKDGLLAVSAGMIMPSIFARAVRAANHAVEEGATFAQAAQNRTLIVVQMAGGNDGLNTLIPYTDGLYHQFRPTLAIPQEQILTLDDRLGLHPALAGFQPFWDDGHLAIVEGVGYPNASLSHFTAMDIWQTLDLSGQNGQGWLGKYVAGLVDKNGHPFEAVATGSSLPTALQALNADVPVISDPKTYRIQPDPAKPTKVSDPLDARTQALLKLYDTPIDSSPYAALLSQTATSVAQAQAQLAQAVTQYQAKATYPTTGFAKGLQVLAEVIVQGLGLRVGYVTLGGFDTHGEQAQTHTKLLTDLAAGVNAFYADLTAHGMADDVVIMTWSEFGRRVQENGSKGTDHGTAAPLFMVGNSVKGGIYGEPPNLGQLDKNGNLVFTMDFRSVYAAVLDQWLGAPSSAVLGGDYSSPNLTSVISA